jgi:hypothetical protein
MLMGGFVSVMKRPGSGSGAGGAGSAGSAAGAVTIIVGCSNSAANNCAANYYTAHGAETASSSTSRAACACASSAASGCATGSAGAAASARVAATLCHSRAGGEQQAAGNQCKYVFIHNSSPCYVGNTIWIIRS